MKKIEKIFSKNKIIPLDYFLEKVLYDKEFGYYQRKNPFGVKGDFVTAPNISNLFSEMIAVWLISFWENLNKPKKINFIELGPGNGDFCLILIKTLKNFPEIYKSINIVLYEKSEKLKKIQKKRIISGKVSWIKDLKKIKKGPVIFFGNEFLDAIPIKQFKRKKRSLFEKYFYLQKNFEIKTVFKTASTQDIKAINSYKCLKNLKFIEFPKDGLELLKKISNKIKALNGCILMIDYGYLRSNNQNTIQSVIKHRKNLKPVGNLHRRCSIISITSYDRTSESLQGNYNFFSELTRA